DKMQEIALEVTPLITDHGNNISLNEKLFKKVEAVYLNREKESLTGDDLRLTEKTYKGFVRSGAALNGVDKEKYREITKELSNLSLQFEQNLLASTNDWTLDLVSTEDLEGLPDYVVEMGAETAKEQGKTGWVFTLHAPSYVSFMQYSSRRDLRHAMWQAYGSRAYGGKYSNNDIVKRITELRIAKANLLGYKTHADYILEERMAKTPARVMEFLSNLNNKVIDYAKKEVKDIADFAAEKCGFTQTLQSWDFSYYSEKYKKERFDLDSEMLKPYFELDKVEKGVFLLCEKLYGLKFIPCSEIPIYNPDVKAYEVVDENDNFVSILYLDYFPRSSKNGGAWMTSFREQKAGVRPIVSVVANFTKPTATCPSLLTFDEFSTLLHEMGHALHGMLSEGTYASLSGTNVAWDFVELPSQIMENWAEEPEYLNLWAKHYKTGDNIPSELIAKIVDAKHFLACYSAVRQLTFGFSDMAWHTQTSPTQKSVKEFETQSTALTKLLPTSDLVCFTPSFAHIFSGGYSAGYYSYKWAELLEADAYKRFKEEGIFNRKVSESFRDNILSKGNSSDAMELYVRFKGAEPSSSALIEKMGISEK
ncbi:MAG: M3 family metallopeptidase, partial [Rikenellaceae bacterium]